MSRSLAILMMLGAACLLAIACQTAGTPPQSLAAAQTRAPHPSAGAAALAQAPTPSSQAAALARSPTPSSQAAAAPQAPPPARSANRNGTARYSGDLVPAISAQVKKLVKAGAIEYAAMAAIVIAVGAAVTVSVRRHRKLTPSSH